MESSSQRVAEKWVKFASGPTSWGSHYWGNRKHRCHRHDHILSWFCRCLDTRMQWRVP